MNKRTIPERDFSVLSVTFWAPTGLLTSSSLRYLQRKDLFNLAIT